MKQYFPAIFIALSMATSALAQGISTRGPASSSENQKAIEQFNADVAAWNARCKITKTVAEESWCKKERARIDARKAELVALGAIPK
ncbi:MAG TPA: hypothetical protein VF345_02000 [Chthoniobacterales bacterium]